MVFVYKFPRFKGHNLLNYSDSIRLPIQIKKVDYFPRKVVGDRYPLGAGMVVYRDCGCSCCTTGFLKVHENKKLGKYVNFGNLRVPITTKNEDIISFDYDIEKHCDLKYSDYDLETIGNQSYCPDEICKISARKNQ